MKVGRRLLQMNFSKLSIQSRILLGVCMLVVGYAASTSIAFFRGKHSETELISVGTLSVPVSIEAQAAVFNFESSAKTFADATMTGEPEALQESATQTKALLVALEKLEARAEEAGLPPTLVGTLRKQVADLQPLREEVFSGMSASTDEEKERARGRAAELTTQTEAIRKAFAVLSENSIGRLQDRLDKNVISNRSLRINNLIVGGVIILVSTGVVLLSVQRGVVRPIVAVVDDLGKTSSSLAHVSHSIKESGQTLADGSSAQAASIEETSATLETIASMASRNAERSTDAKKMVSEAKGAADAGTVSVTQMRGAMDDIKAASDSIARIVKTIDEIAFQTNLLALNAAVEAARAGEAGAGFAVVADEVRSLAQRSAKAARETAELISDSIGKSERGVQISATVSVSLDGIVKRIHAVDALIGEIASASQEQSASVAEVNRAVTALDRITQANAAAAEEAAATDEELGALATRLRGFVEQLNATVYGSKSVRGKAWKGGSRTVNRKEVDVPSYQESNA
jgi:methyl-accepting chemotaxis protein